MLTTTRHETGGDNYWTLDAKAGDVAVNGRTIPYAFSLGTIDPDGRINVWTPAASVPRGYRRVARAKLEAAVARLRREGAIRA